MRREVVVGMAAVCRMVKEVFANEAGSRETALWYPGPECFRQKPRQQGKDERG